MECPQCHHENRNDAIYCSHCGCNLAFACSKCGTEIDPGSRFCDQCGAKFDPELNRDAFEPAKDGERKHVTVLFSDLSGYTALTGKLDPEEVKEITSHLFNKIAAIVEKYAGFIEKYVGDAVMVLFGAEQAHEDDPVRAVRAAVEIHAVTEELSPAYQKKIGSPLRMHTGIYTGLVVTGELDTGRGTHGVAGNALNMASRLGAMASSGQIWVGPVTYRRCEGYFDFESIGPLQVKGKNRPMTVYRYLSTKAAPIKVHRLQGLRSVLIGRKAEIAQLSTTIERLMDGKGSVLSIIGSAGTGKSRLIDEFKQTIDMKTLNWREGHAYSYSQNIPYFPLVNLINRTLDIKEGEAPAEIRQKIESGIKVTVDQGSEIAPYIGSLYSLDYPELKDVSPEYWKTKLQTGLLTLVSAMAAKAPTVICLEDLHWADPSSMELVHFLIEEIRKPVVFILVYRPSMSLHAGSRQNTSSMTYREIKLHDLSSSEALDMVESLLATETIPSELQTFITHKAEGNPFYIEEAINTLIESKILESESGAWKISRDITDADISATIHGVVASRIDRLASESKRILQEASVIGRSFYYEIIKRITDLKEEIDDELQGLERLELIKMNAIKPELEFIFKHAITQEVVYNGLLIKERKKIHQRIGAVIETLFQDRLAEFYETLAFHYKHTDATLKAIDYLVKSGEKSLARYAVSEAFHYFEEAFGILSQKQPISDDDAVVLVDILNHWASAHYYLGEIGNLIDLFTSHQSLADGIADDARRGMFYAWFGIAHFMAGKPRDSYDDLRKALELGERSGADKVTGYACTWLPWTCAELGLLDEGLAYGLRAQQLAQEFPSDQYLFFKSLGGICYINYIKGRSKDVISGAKRLLEYGETNANSRCTVFGHWMEAFGHWVAGDMSASRQACERAIDAALDPAYTQFPKLTLGLAHFLAGDAQQAEEILTACIDFCEPRGMGQITVICRLFLAPALISLGKMQQGRQMLEETQHVLQSTERSVWTAQAEYILGKINLQIARGPKPPVSVMVRNVGFLLRHAPLAGKKAEQHLTRSAEQLKNMGALGLLGQVYLDLAIWHKKNRNLELSREYLSEAINIFRENDAKQFLEQAERDLELLTE